jgi:lipoate---protein ligase
LAEATLHWRLLEDGITDPFLHFAVEETLLRRVSEGKSQPTFRLRQVVPSVFVGVFQDPREDADVDYCREHGIPIVRRPNPGGAVYQDGGSFCYSAFFPKHPTFALLGIQETHDLYRVMGEVVVAWCEGFGVTARAAPVNDVEVGGRKLYGSAQIEMGEAVVHSGTFLIDTDIDAMEAALRPSLLKFADKGFVSVRDRVLNLAAAAGHPISIPDAMHRLVKETETRLPVVLAPGELTIEERQEAQELFETKYAREEWSFPKRKPLVTTLATKAPSGVVMLDLELEGDRIEGMDVRGDFLLERQDLLASLLAGVKGQALPAAMAMIRQGGLPADLSIALLHLLEEGGKRQEGASR